MLNPPGNITTLHEGPHGVKGQSITERKEELIDEITIFRNESNESTSEKVFFIQFKQHKCRVLKYHIGKC